MLKQLSLVIASAVAIGVLTTSVQAEIYPNKPITLVSPKEAGGAADLAARAFAAIAEKYIGQPVRVINQGGGGGVPGMMSVREAKPDGYTLLAPLSTFVLTAPIFKKKNPYKTFDYTYLSILEEQPLTYAVQKDSPYKDMKDLVAALKSSKTPVRIAVAAKIGLATMSFHALVRDLDLASGQVQPIPFKSGPKAARGLLAGDVDVASINLASINASLKSGDARLLMVTSSKRNHAYPDVPTAKEMGLPTVDGIALWTGLVGPKDLPDDVVKKWEQVLPKVFADPMYSSLLIKRGASQVGTLPSDTAQIVKAQEKGFLELKTALEK